MQTLKDLGICLLSAFLLIFSFPQVELWPLAWVALVPLLLLIDNRSYKSAFGCFYLCGFVFFFGTLGWLVYVTWPGAVLLAAFLALYFGLFGWMYVYFRRFNLIPRLFILAAGWAVLEYVRGHLFTGFGWAALGHSQYKNLGLIQIADVTGIYGISFVVILGNLVIAETIKARNRGTFKLCFALAVILAGVYGYGAVKINEFGNKLSPSIKVGIVQPNIPQMIKWEAELRPMIVKEHIQLSQSLKKDNVDLIIWPETSMPGMVSENPELVEEIKASALALKTPILIGAITQMRLDYFNSALLINGRGEIKGQYDKIHLVPFGEYLPLRPVLGWINTFVPLEDFTSGKDYTILSLDQDKQLGILICFEDTLSYLARNFTKAGAKLFINITNDAWFQDTKAPFMHLQTAIFQAVENRRALVRAANTGVSGFVDPTGRIVKTVQNEKGKQTFIKGTMVVDAPLHTSLTFYTKYGDVFTMLCFLGILGSFIYSRRRYA